MIALQGKPVELELHGEEKPLIFRFVFATSNEGEKAFSNWKAHSPQLAEFTLYNHNSPISTGNKEPIEIGSFGGKKLLVDFRTQTLEGAGHLLIYTISVSG